MIEYYKRSAIYFLLCILPMLLSAQQSQYWTGDGGRGMRLAILRMESRNLPANQNYLPDLVQKVLVDNISKYSAIDVVDRVALERVIADNMDQSVHRDGNFDIPWIGEQVQARYVMTGEIIRTSAGYSLSISVTENTNPPRTLATHTGNYTAQQLDDHTAMHSASKDLLPKMGVTLTATAIRELDAVVSRNQIVAQVNLAQGITAQRQGTEVQALSYFFQAAALDPTLFEAISRSDIAVQNIRTGNIGVDARNAIAWRNAWVARLRETEEYFHNILTNAAPPYNIFYTTEFREGDINYQKETITLLFPFEITANLEWFYSILDPMAQVVQAVYDGLQTTGKAREWQLQDWPNTGVTQTNPFGVYKRWEHEFVIAMSVLNGQNRVIGSSRIRFDKRTFRIYKDNNNKIVYEFQKKNRADGGLSLFPIEVNANEITDRLTVRIDSINNTPSLNAKIPIYAVSQLEFNHRMYSSFGTDADQRAEQAKAIQERERERIARESRLAIKAGDIIRFGEREWIVLERTGSNALLLHKDFLNDRNMYDNRQDHNSSVQVHWANCSLRSYLNSSFYHTFNNIDRERILETRVLTGTQTTTDRIFILSPEEAKKYFESGIDILEPQSESAGILRGVNGSGYFNNGRITADGESMWTTGGAGAGRPVMWISLESQGQLRVIGSALSLNNKTNLVEMIKNENDMEPFRLDTILTKFIEPEGEHYYTFTPTKSGVLEIQRLSDQYLQISLLGDNGIISSSAHHPQGKVTVGVERGVEYIIWIYAFENWERGIYRIQATLR